MYLFGKYEWILNRWIVFVTSSFLTMRNSSAPKNSSICDYKTNLWVTLNALFGTVIYSSTVMMDLYVVMSQSSVHMSYFTVILSDSMDTMRDPYMNRRYSWLTRCDSFANTMSYSSLVTQQSLLVTHRLLWVTHGRLWETNRLRWVTYCNLHHRTMSWSMVTMSY